MLIRFSPLKDNILFLADSDSERKILSKFPGFVKTDLNNSCPVILPVVFNLVERCLKTFKTVRVETALREWLDQPFKLLPIPESFNFHTTPKDFQEIALRFLYTIGSAGILLDPGMGKTKVVLDYIFLKQFKLSFIVCPAALLFVWEDEIQKHRPELKYHIVKTTNWEIELPHIQSLTGNVVVILNYDKAVILKHRIKELQIDFIHLDEFLIKDPATNRSKSLVEIARGIPYRCGGSGTLINNSPLDSFTPVKFLQPSLVGYNYGNFMERYCVMKDMVSNEGVKSKRPVAYKNQVEIRSILDSCCIVMTKEKWLKLPDKHFHDVYVQMEGDQKEAYYSLMKNYYISIQGKDLYVENPLVMMSKLYQISQGFIYITEQISISEDGVAEVGDIDVELYDLLAEPERKKALPRETVFFQSQPKIAALRKILTQDLKGKKSIIWFNMSAEFELIKKLLDELGHKFLSIKGGDKKIGEKVRAFNRSAETQWLVCQAKSVNYGITVLGSKKIDLEKEGVIVFPDLDTSVHNEVFFSLNFSLEVYSQQQDRIHRLGQDLDCHYWRIFANNPVETKIRQALSEKLNIRMEMLVDIMSGILLDTDSTIVM